MSTENASRRDESVAWPDATAIREAADRIRDHVVTTPVVEEDGLNRAIGCRVLLKCENHQVGGAFKARGASNAVFSLPASAAARGVATHSSGNHGSALARAAARRAIPAHVVMPRGAARTKRDAVEAQGARLVECEPTMAGRIAALEAVVAETGATVVHPYEQTEVMAGQGTVALELAPHLEAGDRLLVPLGGGGLISGMSRYLAEVGPAVSIIGVEPAGADDALRSFRAGRVVPVTPDTVADGLRATVGVTNLSVIRSHVDDIVTVSDDAIREAMALIREHTGMVVEPSAAVSVAALMTGVVKPAGREVCVLTGGNLDTDRFPIS